jgi:hypothetical protein
MSNTQLHTNETIFDVALREFGHIQGLFNLVKDNGLSYSSMVEPGTELLIDETASYAEMKTISFTHIKREQPKEVTPKPNQNIYDLAIQEFGTIEGVFNLVKNNNISLSTTVEAGSALNAEGEVLEKLIYNYFQARTKPATGNMLIVDSEPVQTGIGYMAIEIDFIVS